jgi:hypothetical protein
VALRTTVPAPVSVTVEPEIVAGPETTEYVKAPVEFEVALTVNGVSPKVWSGTMNVIAGADVLAATVKVAFSVPATKLASAASEACSTTVPAPVRVTVEPEIVAGPETTEYVNAPVELEVALTANGASPKVWFGTTNTIAGVAAATVKVAFLESAAKLASAASAACSTTGPAPVRVTVEPEMVAGPETTEYVNAPVEFEVALTVNGASPKLWFGIVNTIAGVGVFTVRLKVAVAVALLASVTVTV